MVFLLRGWLFSLRACEAFRADLGAMTSTDDPEKHMYGLDTYFYNVRLQRMDGGKAFMRYASQSMARQIRHKKRARF